MKKYEAHRGWALTRGRDHISLILAESSHEQHGEGLYELLSFVGGLASVCLVLGQKLGTEMLPQKGF